MVKGTAKIKENASQITKSAVKMTKNAADVKNDAKVVGRGGALLWNAILKGVHKTVKVVLKLMPFIIALMMFLYGAARLYNGISGEQSFTNYWYVYISSILMVVCGILMAVFYKAPMTTLIGFFTIGIASNRLLQGIYMFFQHPDSDVLMFAYLIISLIFIALATNMLISSSFYFRGISRKRRGMLISGILFLIFELVQIVLFLRSGMSLPEIFQTYPSEILRIALYVVYIILLSTEEIRNRELLEHQSRALDGIRTTYLCDPFARIDRQEAVKVANLYGNWDMWKDKRGWGPVEYEYRFVIKNRNDHTFVTVQKWKGCDRMYFTAAKNHHGSLLDANRFAVDKILLDGTPEECTNIRFFNNEGLYIQVPVRDRKENDLDDGHIQ